MSSSTLSTSSSYSPEKISTDIYEGKTWKEIIDKAKDDSQKSEYLKKFMKSLDKNVVENKTYAERSHIKGKFPNLELVNYHTDEVHELFDPYEETPFSSVSNIITYYAVYLMQLRIQNSKLPNRNHDFEKIIPADPVGKGIMFQHDENPIIKKVYGYENVEVYPFLCMNLEKLDNLANSSEIPESIKDFFSTWDEHEFSSKINFNLLEYNDGDDGKNIITKIPELYEDSLTGFLNNDFSYVQERNEFKGKEGDKGKEEENSETPKFMDYKREYMQRYNKQIDLFFEYNLSDDTRGEIFSTFNGAMIVTDEVKFKEKLKIESNLDFINKVRFGLKRKEKKIHIYIPDMGYIFNCLLEEDENLKTAWSISVISLGTRIKEKLDLIKSNQNK